jgi:hypothetical protein
LVFGDAFGRAPPRELLDEGDEQRGRDDGSEPLRRVPSDRIRRYEEAEHHVDFGCENGKYRRSQGKDLAYFGPQHHADGDRARHGQRRDDERRK